MTSRHRHTRPIHYYLFFPNSSRSFWIRLILRILHCTGRRQSLWLFRLNITSFFFLFYTQTLNCFASRILHTLAVLISFVLYAVGVPLLPRRSKRRNRRQKLRLCDVKETKKEGQMEKASTGKRTAKAKTGENLWPLDSSSPTNGKTSYCVSVLIVMSSTENAEIQEAK